MINELKEKNVQISAERFLELLKAENELDSLKCVGVDNWQGYGEHINEMLPDKDLILTVKTYLV